MREYLYDAFISYRHLPADIAVAEKLQTFLERHKKKNGEKLRIFRDRTELPTSSDLGNQIQRALENSRFLILVCSPAYLASKWCMEELRYFRQLHGGRNVNILPLLLEGEPGDVFPKEICHELRRVPDENGMTRMVRVEVEPLGADIRADSSRKRLKKLRTEYLRLAAPLLDVSFDALYQRAKRRQIVTIAIASAAVVAAATAFALYNVHMTRQIDQAHQALLSRESLRLATESQEILETGDINLATLLALEALPADLSNPERPLTPEAETALRSAVYSHMSQQHYAPVRLITSVEFNIPSWTFLDAFQQGSVFAVTDQELIYFYDNTTGALLYSCPGNSSECHILNDGELVVCLENENFGKDTLSAAIYNVSQRRQIYFREFQAEDLYPELLMLPGSDTLYFVGSGWDENDQPLDVLLEAVNPDGTAADEQILPPVELLEQPHVCAVMYDSPYLETENDYYWMTGDDHEPGPTSQQGQQYQGLIEQLWQEDYASATITQTEDLLIFETKGVDARNIIHSMELLRQDIYRPVTLSGSMYIDSVNKRFYCDNGSTLQVYTYDLTRFPEPKSATLVSPDGSRYAIGNAIYSSGDLSVPLLDPQCKEGYDVNCHLTPDLEYVFHQTPQDTFQLWSVSDGMLMELVPNEDNNKNVVALSVNQDGTLVALAHNDQTVEVYNRDSEFIASFTFPDEIWHVEFEGSRLLISGMLLSWIADVYAPDAIMEIPAGTHPTYPTDQHLTSDGLYLCAGQYFEDALDAIYDLETGECVFRNHGYYQYNEENGILLYTPTDPRFAGNPLLHAAKRDADGIFRDIYTIKTQGFDMVLPRTPAGAGARYFLLMDSSCLQLYETATGSLVYSMYFGPGRDAYLHYNLFIQNDILYDLRFYDGGCPAVYPMLDLADALRRTDTYLTSPLATRELSAQEKAAYFIENET